MLINAPRSCSLGKADTIAIEGTIRLIIPIIKNTFINRTNPKGTRSFWIMTPKAYIGIDYKNLRNREHPHSFSVLRARFDPWFAEQAEKVGAMVVPETVVERLIVKNGRVVGVGTGRGDDIFAESDLARLR